MQLCAVRSCERRRRAPPAAAPRRRAAPLARDTRARVIPAPSGLLEHSAPSSGQSRYRNDVASPAPRPCTGRVSQSFERLPATDRPRDDPGRRNSRRSRRALRARVSWSRSRGCRGSAARLNGVMATSGWSRPYAASWIASKRCSMSRFFDAVAKLPYSVPEAIQCDAQFRVVVTMRPP